MLIGVPTNHIYLVFFNVLDSQLRALHYLFHIMDEYSKVKRILGIAFMQYLDKNKAKSKRMCLSNMECEDIDRAFDEQDWSKIYRYAEKYLKDGQ